uniref:J domain-containing protein n=1 Tax=Plectus sambesii TaxID=2011161 RepID=A0A914X506_9BILA
MYNIGQSCFRNQRQLSWTRFQHCFQIFVSSRYKSTLRKRDYYEVLGVSRLANKKVIRDAYIAKSKKLHPDRLASSSNDATAHEKFIELQEAYEVLSHRGTRIEYDSVSRRQQSSTARKSRSDTSGSHHSDPTRSADQSRRDQSGNQADESITADQQRVRGGETDDLPMEKVVLLWTRRISLTILLSLLILG